MLVADSRLGSMEEKSPSHRSLILLHSCWKQDESVHETALSDSLSESTSHFGAHLAPDRRSSTAGQQRPRDKDLIYND